MLHLQCALSLMNLGDNYLSWGKLDEASTWSDASSSYATAAGDHTALLL